MTKKRKRKITPEHRERLRENAATARAAARQPAQPPAEQPDKRPNPFSKGGSPRSVMPANVVPRTYEYALTAPRLVDVAAKFGVTLSTFKKWMAQQERIKLAFDAAKAQLAEDLLEKQRKLADGGNAKAVERYLTAHRPDLVKPENEIAVNVAAQVSVVPQPKSLEDYRKELGVTIEGELATHTPDGSATDTPVSDTLFSRRKRGS